MAAADADLELLLGAAEEAGRAALAYFNPGRETSARVTLKAGDSPVSEADHAANAALETHLRQLRPDYGWVSEETVDGADRLAMSRVFVVDPIDGTRAFIAGRLQWSVSVALVVDGRAAAGVIHAPSLGVTYAARAGAGATCNGRPLRVSARSGLAGAHAAGPKPSLEQLERESGAQLTYGPKIPSLALRMALAAEGRVDLAIASAGAHDWDVAAADIILAEAGGVLLDLDGLPLVYNRPSLRRGVLCAGAKDIAMAASRALRLRR